MKNLQKKTVAGVLGIYLLMAVCILMKEYQIPYILVCMDVETEEAESFELITDSEKGNIKSVISEGEVKFLISSEFEDVGQMTLCPDLGKVAVEQIRIYSLGIPAGNFGKEELEAGGVFLKPDGSIGIGGAVIQKIKQALQGDRNCKILFLLLGSAGYAAVVLICIYCWKWFQKNRGCHLERFTGYCRENILFLGICGLATVVYLWWHSQLPQWGTSQLPHDDSLFVEWGLSLVKGEWLGSYGNRTLIKRPMYAVFVALCHNIGISSLFGLGLLQAAAACVFVTAFSSVLKSRIVKGILYLYLLFLPAMYGSAYVQGTSRMCIVPSSVILVAACLSAVYLRRKKSLWELLPWEIAAGVFIVFFWNIREDSIWFLPFIAGAVLFTAIAFFFENKDRNRKFWVKLMSFVFPLLCILIGNGALRGINYYHYGVSTISELDDSNFGTLINAIYSIEQEEEIEYVQVNYSTVEKLYEVSPSLASIKPQIEAMYNSVWQTWGTGKDDGEIEGGYFLWAMRDAIDQAGYYNNAVSADEFCKKAAGEIEKAFEDGQLQKQKRIINSSLFNKWKDYYPALLAEKIVETAGWIVNYREIVPGISESTGTESELRQMEYLYGRSFVRSSRQKLYLNGWCFALEEGAEVTLYLLMDGSEARRVEIQDSSQDVYEYFLALGSSYENARNSRFTIETETEVFGQLELEIYVDGVLAGSINLLDEKSRGSRIESETYLFQLDRLETEIAAVPLTKQSEFAVKLFTGAAFLYRCSGSALAVLGISGALVVIAGLFIDKENRKEYHFGEVFLILLGILTVFAALIFGVSYTYVEAWNSQSRLIYMAGAFSLMVMFNGLSIGTAVPYIWKRMKNRRRKEQ